MINSAFKKEPSRKLVLIDDDQAFGRIMTSFALSRGLQLDYFESLQQMGSIGFFKNYAVAIVDYDLGDLNGIEIAEYLPVFFGDLPMILISGLSRQASGERPWPVSVKSFIHKDVGPDAILDASLAYFPPITLKPAESDSTKIANS